MKVFTVGLDDKEKAQKVDVEKTEPLKVAEGMVPQPMAMPPPIILPRAPPKKRFGCGVMSWVVAAFFVVLLCLTISEITYNRQRDQAFLRLKWAELRQRMLGFELLSQAQQQNQHQQQQEMLQPQPQIQQPINELPAFRRNDLPDNAVKATTPTAPSVKPTDASSEDEKDVFPPKFDLLRMLLSKMREHAEQMGMNGEMQVHVVEVRPVPDKMPQQSIDDAFGEVGMARPQPFDSWRNDEDPNEMGNRVDLPWQFEHEGLRPSPWTRPFDRFNRMDAPQFAPDPRVPHDNSILGPAWDAMVDEPKMRITHHFEKNSQTPQRVVTEVFGDNAPDLLGHMLGQKNAQAQLQFQQQQEMMQQQQQQHQLQQPQPHPQPQAQQQPQPQPQPWPHPWAQVAAQPWPHWTPPVQVWDQPRWEQLPIPQQQPMFMLFNQAPPQQPQFQQQPPPPPPPFLPAIANQNQFPIPAHNQPLFPDYNNNINNNAFNENAVNQRPWYMGGDEKKWQQTWENTNNQDNINKVDTPVNPHPLAALPWVDSSAVVEPQPQVQQPPPTTIPEQTIGHDSDGIEGFPREEKFNVPVDIANDVAAQHMDVAPESALHPDVQAEHPWQHAQPEAAEEPMPASVPMEGDAVAAASPTEGKDFLPLRPNEEVMAQPQNDAEKAGVIVAQDDFPKKHEAPFFQIDDPSAFRH